MDRQRLLQGLRNDPAVPLDAAALEMAKIEFPDLAPEPYLEALDEMAAEIDERIPAGAQGIVFVQEMNHYLFEELRFAGNETDYYNPRNSCLNAVLDTRHGIPITLALLFLEISRRLGRPVFGIGLPSHFVIQYNDLRYVTYIDPFHGGRLLSREDCVKLVAETSSAPLADNPGLFDPVNQQYILTRMLNNLRGAYIRAQEYHKTIEVLDVLIDAFPRTADYFKARGVAHLQLHAFRAASEDLSMYLTCSPDASDRKEIVEQLEAIHRWLGSLN
jgi:regulator of sirC expression with transglutaminase-like and TPR domain